MEEKEIRDKYAKFWSAVFQNNKITSAAKIATKTCSSCSYWIGRSAQWNHCRRHAPNGQKERNLATWPETEPDQWCGDWEQRVEQP